MRAAVTRDLKVRDLDALGRPPQWLRAVADESAVTIALRRRVPQLRSCAVERIRVKQSGFQALYRATIECPDQRSALEVPLLGEIVADCDTRPEESVVEIGDRGWRCSLPDLHLQLRHAPADGGLAALPDLTDPERARRLIVEALRTTRRFSGYDALACSHHVTRYKAGSRCTVAYELRLPPGAPAHWPEGVVAKTYHGDKGRIAWEAMLALWQSPMRQSPWTSIAEPLVLVREGQVLLQRSIRHRETLKDVTRTVAGATKPAFERLFRLSACAGAALADLHASGVTPALGASWDAELADVRRMIDRLAVLVPTLSGAANGLLCALDHQACAVVAQAAVPSHGSFRPAQLVVTDEDALGMIDFDSFCLGEPAMDVALFCSSLRDTAFRAWLDGSGQGGDPEAGLRMCDAVCEDFVAGYTDRAPLARTRVALWEAMYALTGVLHCWTKVKFDRLAYRTALLRHHLERGELA
jgi:hypothetical protein